MDPMGCPTEVALGVWDHSGALALYLGPQGWRLVLGGPIVPERDTAPRVPLAKRALPGAWGPDFCVRVPGPRVCPMRSLGSGPEAQGPRPGCHAQWCPCPGTASG